MPKFEWRVRWSAFSNIKFAGESDWEPWEGDEETVEAVEEAVDGSVEMSPAAEKFVEASGVSWSVEVREISS